MVNSFIFTGLILLAGLAGGLIGSACGKRRNAPDIEGRIAELEDRLDALATHCMEEAKQIKQSLSAAHTKTNDLYDQLSVLKAEDPEWEILTARINELEFLVGDTPTGGLLGRVGALEDAQKTHEQDAVIVNGWAEEIKTLKLKQEAFEHRTLGWQEGFGGEVRKQLKRMDERITNQEVQGE